MGYELKYILKEQFGHQLMLTTDGERLYEYAEQITKLSEAAKNELQMWYLHDKGISVQDELVVLMLDWDLQNQQEE